jgi:hypothetical protein
VNIRNANTRAAYGRAAAADICAYEIVESANRARSTGASASVGGRRVTLDRVRGEANFTRACRSMRRRQAAARKGSGCSTGGATCVPATNATSAIFCAGMERPRWNGSASSRAFDAVKNCTLFVRDRRVIRAVDFLSFLEAENCFCDAVCQRPRDVTAFEHE